MRQCWIAPKPIPPGAQIRYLDDLSGDFRKDRDAHGLALQADSAQAANPKVFTESCQGHVRNPSVREGLAAQIVADGGQQV
jgi:hypothetical protein